MQIVRVIKGRGDVFDTSGRIASIKGAALNMPTGLSSEGTVNLSQENDDLKVTISNMKDDFFLSVTRAYSD